ncbi:hypothetical protein MAMC_01028 [Methylacidimicrobium cyclopophantes]|uniref:Uncharacterized protein n=1 Tax=Methylacidimicrobium cyclopophantes TaxID=1041766 RepID=A0A5E6MJQ7_9BACT|nr:hypothetical protein [Methylacidimicrobium cyclopophantes]VVM06307.1 hypothetical protein MAMC_01028 [Methylacidimicrobium cyclopophantes]
MKHRSIALLTAAAFAGLFAGSALRASGANLTAESGSPHAKMTAEKGSCNQCSGKKEKKKKKKSKEGEESTQD